MHYLVSVLSFSHCVGRLAVSNVIASVATGQDDRLVTTDINTPSIKVVITTSLLCPCLHSAVTAGSLARFLSISLSSFFFKFQTPQCHVFCVFILLCSPSTTLSHVIAELAGPALPVRVT